MLLSTWKVQLNELFVWIGIWLIVGGEWDGNGLRTKTKEDCCSTLKAVGFYKLSRGEGGKSVLCESLPNKTFWSFRCPRFLCWLAATDEHGHQPTERFLTQIALRCSSNWPIYLLSGCNMVGFFVCVVMSDFWGIYVWLICIPWKKNTAKARNVHFSSLCGLTLAPMYRGLGRDLQSWNIHSFIY